jgi:hypothetical protein
VVLSSASSVWQKTTPASQSKPALRTSRVVAKREPPMRDLVAVPGGGRTRGDDGDARSGARVATALAFRNTTGNWRP